MKSTAKAKPSSRKRHVGSPGAGAALGRFREIEKKLEKFGRARRFVTVKGRTGEWRNADCLISPEG